MCSTTRIDGPGRRRARASASPTSRVPGRVELARSARRGPGRPGRSASSEASATSCAWPPDRRAGSRSASASIRRRRERLLDALDDLGDAAARGSSARRRPPRRPWRPPRRAAWPGSGRAIPHALRPARAIGERGRRRSPSISDRPVERAADRCRARARTRPGRASSCRPRSAPASPTTSPSGSDEVDVVERRAARPGVAIADAPQRKHQRHGQPARRRTPTTTSATRPGRDQQRQRTSALDAGVRRRPQQRPAAGPGEAARLERHRPLLDLGRASRGSPARRAAATPRDRAPDAALRVERRAPAGRR